MEKRQKYLLPEVNRLNLFKSELKVMLSRMRILSMSLENILLKNDPIVDCGYNLLGGGNDKELFGTLIENGMSKYERSLTNLRFTYVDELNTCYTHMCDLIENELVYCANNRISLDDFISYVFSDELNLLHELMIRIDFVSLRDIDFELEYLADIACDKYRNLDQLLSTFMGHAICFYMKNAYIRNVFLRNENLAVIYNSLQNALNEIPKNPDHITDSMYVSDLYTEAIINYSKLFNSIELSYEEYEWNLLLKINLAIEIQDMKKGMDLFYSSYSSDYLTQEAKELFSSTEKFLKDMAEKYIPKDGFTSEEYRIFSASKLSFALTRTIFKYFNKN